MNGWSPKNYKKTDVGAIAASQTNVAITEPFSISGDGATSALVVKLKASGISGTVTLKLQTSIDGDWVDSKTATVSTSETYLKLLAAAAADQTYFPLLSTGRLVITTAAASGITVAKVQVLQGL